ncbi:MULTISPECIES: dUTP diphosphatase [Bacillus]|uniref:dUTP diphosphatase n=1 Tax=Bacillus TaxID=1386 RepID=UPI000BB8DCEF|nr:MULTISPECIES: dUTP diphosphatase [Bacillus]
MDYELKVKRVHTDAQLPFRANVGDAGLDLFSVEEKVIKSGEAALIRTGLVLELPKGTEAQVRPRSGLALKHSVTVLNSPGTIDEGYRGEVKVILINHGKKDFLVEKNMRVAQMVMAPVTKVNIVQVEEVTDTSRGVGGFGSSGINKE